MPNRISCAYLTGHPELLVRFVRELLRRHFALFLVLHPWASWVLIPIALLDGQARDQPTRGVRIRSWKLSTVRCDR